MYNNKDKDQHKDSQVEAPKDEPKKVESNKLKGKSTSTTKKKAVRTFKREVIDRNTGEIEEQTVIETEEDSDYNWEKAWLINLFLAFQELGSKRVEVAMWLLKNKNSDNQIVYTQREVAEKTKISLKTVNETFKLLIGCDAVRRKNGRGVAMWNPDIVAKGGTKRRSKLVIEFSKLPKAKSKK